MKILALICGIIASIIMFLSTQVKNKKKLTICFFSFYTLFAFNFILIGAITGGITCLISAFQTFIIYNNKNLNKKIILLIIITIITGILTYKNLLSIMPIIGNLIFIAVITCNNMKKMRTRTLASRLIWCIYDFLCGAYLIFIADFISVIGIIIAIFKYDFEKEKYIKIKKIFRFYRKTKKVIYLN